MGELIKFFKVPDQYEKFFEPFENEFERFIFERYRRQYYHKRLKLFYSMKYLIPRFIQIFIRRLLANASKNTFPAWPIETYLEEFKRKILQNFSGDIPFIWFWPNNKNFAFCLTHDVETKEGLKKIHKICDIEKRFGLRSAWYFVCEKYRVSDNLIKELKEEKFEVGIHGLKHDGKLFSSKSMFDKRKERIRVYVEKWNAKGFRSPSLLRNVEWIQELPVEYDSSFPDTDPFGPQAGGCLSIFPFFIGNLVELPVTLPQDHTLFEILKQRDIGIWRRKLEWIEKMHGLALLIVHPDYFNSHLEKCYCELLEFVLRKENFWYATPVEIARWWRKRSNCNLILDKTPYVVPDKSGVSISYLDRLLKITG
ncbi:MAG: hypothetical protein ABIL39_03545 [candidate division WOR-3 bacterium]